MTSINGLPQSNCNIGALQNLELLRKPVSNPRLEKMRLLTFLPDPYVFPDWSKYSPSSLEILKANFIADSNTQIAIRMHKQAINDIMNNNAVPFYAVVYDALPEPPKMPKQEPKSLNISMTERLTRRMMQNTQKSKISKAQIKKGLRAKSEFKSQKEILDTGIREILVPKPSKFKKICKNVKQAVKSVFSKAATVIF